MTDNRTTELRELLTERGVKYQAIGKRLTYWNRDGSDNECDDADFVADQQPDGTLVVDGLTPEQAIAATLGRPKVKKVRGLTYDEHGGEVYYLACSGCGDWVDGDLDCIGEDDGPNFCHHCGGEFDGPLLCRACGELADMEFGDMCAGCYLGEGEGNDER